jgi:hypothetical protein
MFCRLLLGCTWFVLLGLAGWMSPTPAQAIGGPDKLASQVKGLVDQLESAGEKEKVAAEWELLKLGPDILPLLPSAEKMSDNVKERLLSIKTTLLELRPRTVTLGKTEMPLVDALKWLQKHTGLAVVDRRQGGHDQRVHLAFAGANFWQAVELIAAQVNANISLYQADGQVALVDAPYRKLEVSLAGPFRVAVKRTVTAKDQDAGTHVCIVVLELAWEPRLLPFLVDAGPVSLRAGKDDKGKPFVAQLPSRGAVRVTGALAHEFELMFPAPNRKAGQIDELKGHFTVTTPTKMLAFTFKKLQALAKPGPNESQTQDGVSVTLNKINVQKDRWTVEVAIENPKAGPQFESHQTWLGNNTLHLEKGREETLVVLKPEALLEQQFNVTSTRAIIRYHFLERNAAGIALGQISDWRLVCRTPGRMVEVTVPYAFKNLELP